MVYVSCLVAVGAIGCSRKNVTTRTEPAEIGRETEGRRVGAFPGDQSPDVTLVLEAGGTKRLSQIPGKVRVLNFWAAWCVPCIAEMPSLDALQRRLRSEGLVVVAVNTDASPDVAAVFIAHKGFTFTVLYDPTGDAARRFLVRSIPLTLVIDARGVVVERVEGARKWDDAATVERMTRWLDEDPAQ